VKKLICLLLILTILPWIIHSQYHHSGLKSVNLPGNGFRSAHYSDVGLGISFRDSLDFSQVILQLDKAGKLARTGVALGAITNISILANATVLTGDLEGWQGLIGLVGLSTGTTRLFYSFFTPKQIRLAGEMLMSTGNTIWDENQLNESLRHIRIAKNASNAAPFLGLVGFGLITGSIFGIANGNEFGYIAWCMGWGCAVAGLTTSIVSNRQLSKARKVLISGGQNLDLGVNDSGLGLAYGF
jgi:hypothetical protein